MTNRQISVHLDVKLKSNYDYKKTVLNYLDKLIAGINQATPATPAPQDNGGDVDADATLPTAPGSAAAAVAGDASVAGPDAANVSQGAGAGRTGDGASYEDKMKELELKMAEMNYQRAAQIAELDVKQKGHMVKLEVRQKELEVQQEEKNAETQEQINKNKIAISELRVGLTKVGATANCALESSNNAIERVEGLHDQLSRTATKKDLQSLKEKIKEEMRRSEDDGMKEDGGEDDGLVGAALDFSDSSSDDESALPPRRAGVTAVTPMDKKTVKVSKVAPEREFLRLLKEAMHYGQGGKEFEMDACLKRAEHIMNSTKLNEEWNRWHANFNKRSECARKLCSQYGSKPAAR